MNVRVVVVDDDDDDDEGELACAEKVVNVWNVKTVRNLDRIECGTTWLPCLTETIDACLENDESSRWERNAMINEAVIWPLAPMRSPIY
jgi:hypothetical protein